MSSDIVSSFSPQSSIGPSSSVSQSLYNELSNQSATDITITSAVVPTIPTTLEVVPGNKRTRRVVLYPTNIEFRPDFLSWWEETPCAKYCDQKKIRPRWNGGRVTVWECFTEAATVPNGDPLVRCNVCYALFAHPNFPKRNGTTNLNLHSKKCGTESQQVSTPGTRVGITQYLIKKENAYSHDRFVDRILHFVIACRLPFRTVEHIQFRRMLDMANPDIRIPSRQIIKTRLQELAVTTHAKLIAKIPQNSKISLALDCWTSPDSKPFLAIAAYFIDDAFKFQEMLLAFRPIEGEHTGSHLSSMVQEVLQKYSLQTRVLAITTDNASNNGKMMQELTVLLKQRFQTDLVQFDHQLHTALQNASSATQELVQKPQHIPCLAHILQLAVTAFLAQLKIESEDDQIVKGWSNIDQRLVNPPGLTRSLEKVRKITKFINASPQRRQKFVRIQQSESNSSSTTYLLLQDCKTRWNSTYQMLCRALKLQHEVRIFIQTWTVHDVQHLQLSDIEWKHIEYLIELLYPFFSFTANLSVSGPSVQDVYSIYDVLFNHLEDSMARLENKQASWKKQLVIALRKAYDKLRKYYAHTYQAEGFIYAISTILNPSQKLSAFQQSSWLDDDVDWHSRYSDTFHELFQYYSALHPDAVTPSVPSLNMPGVQQVIFEFRQRRQKQATVPAQLFPELTTYLREGTENPDNLDVLQWWQTHAHRFPVLACMARDFLAIPSSGVGVERLFNSARDICHYRRSRLHMETIEAIMIQMCTDRFMIATDYAELHDVYESEKPIYQQDLVQYHDRTLLTRDSLMSSGYISDDEDPEVFDRPPITGSNDDAGDHEAGVQNTSRMDIATSGSVDTPTSGRSLRHYIHVPGQYRE